MPLRRTNWHRSGVRVWDRGVRVFHWSLAAAVVTSLLTGFFAPRTVLRGHLIAGACIAALLFFRIVWGVLGGLHARFRSFAHPPRVILRHLRGVLAGRSGRHHGHNPLGSLMVFGFLVVLTAMAVTGALALGGVLKQGPFAAFIGYGAGARVLTIHYVMAFVVAAMIVLHLGGVAMESSLARLNLIRAMVTGRKAVAPGAPTSVRPARRLAAIIVGGGIALAGIVLAALSRLPVPGIPPATVDPVWAEQCGACHFPFPPSLAPGWVWSGIFADLKHHYGNSDASLSPELAAQLRAYALANSAEHWDTQAAHLFSIRDKADPGRITSTPDWRWLHADIPASVFARSAVGSKAACNACHQDAESGMFAPQAIVVPR